LCVEAVPSMDAAPTLTSTAIDAITTTDRLQPGPRNVIGIRPVTQAEGGIASRGTQEAGV
jgi:hypothetical protein